MELKDRLKQPVPLQTSAKHDTGLSHAGLPCLPAALPRFASFSALTLAALFFGAGSPLAMALRAATAGRLLTALPPGAPPIFPLCDPPPPPPLPLGATRAAGLPPT